MSQDASRSEQPSPPEDVRSGEVTIHPPLDQWFLTVEHYAGELDGPGDALGRDCIVARFRDGWIRMYDGDGSRNEDWYSWRANVFAPFDGTVERVHIATTVNEPGRRGSGMPGFIFFLRHDGVHVVYAHLDECLVREGDNVTSDQLVGKVGNNGIGWHPHLHVGAYWGEQPLQIRFDLEVMGRLLKRQ